METTKEAITSPGETSTEQGEAVEQRSIADDMLDQLQVKIQGMSKDLQAKLDDIHTKLQKLEESFGDEPLPNEKEKA